VCGIAGIITIGSGEPVAKEMLVNMTDAMLHRGPDGAGTWLSADRCAGLGHRRLSIVDLSDAGSQPMGNADGSIQISFNGEIYNFRELRKELQAAGYVFRSQSDTEVIVYLYEKYGDDFVEMLDGDFALGIWDERRKRLILARDRIGVKPLYYMQWAGRFYFASEIRALIRARGSVPELDTQALYDYLTFLVVPPPRTLCQGIFKLPAASTLTLQSKLGTNWTIRKFWEPVPDPSKISAKDLDEQLRELFAASVKKRLMSDVPVGVLFSGGVDSSLNAASFGELIAPQKVRTFTVRTVGDSRFEQEGVFARQMAERLGTSHHEVEISEQDLLTQAMELAHMQDEPVSDPVTVPLYFVTRLARQTGTIVLHAGEGADEVFCGYDSYRRFMRQHQNLWQPLSLLPRGLAGIGYRLLRLSTSPLHQKVADALRRSARGQEFFMSSAVAYYEDEKQGVLARGFREQLKRHDSYAVVEPLYRRIRELVPGASFLQQLTFIELQLRLPELLLMRADKMSMANSVEVRVPFLDRDLVDFALAAPERFKLRDGISKEPIKRLAAQYLPQEAIYRPKSGFGAPIQSWFKGELGVAMRALLDEQRTTLQQWLDVPALDRRLRTGPETVNRAFQLWVIFNLCNWQRSLRGAAASGTATREPACA